MVVLNAFLGNGIKSWKTWSTFPSQATNWSGFQWDDTLAHSTSAGVEVGAVDGLSINTRAMGAAGCHPFGRIWPLVTRAGPRAMGWAIMGR